MIRWLKERSKDAVIDEGKFKNKNVRKIFVRMYVCVSISICIRRRHTDLLVEYFKAEISWSWNLVRRADNLLIRKKKIKTKKDRCAKNCLTGTFFSVKWKAKLKNFWSLFCCVSVQRDINYCTKVWHHLDIIHFCLYVALVMLLAWKLQTLIIFREKINNC